MMITRVIGNHEDRTTLYLAQFSQETDKFPASMFRQWHQTKAPAPVLDYGVSPRLPQIDLRCECSWLPTSFS